MNREPECVRFADLPLNRFAQAVEGTPAQRGLAWRIQACFRDRVGGLGKIHIMVVGSTVLLRGELDSLREKWLSLECCRHVPGVARVIDELVISAPSTGATDLD